jgi:hypothetical protein
MTYYQWQKMVSLDKEWLIQQVLNDIEHVKDRDINEIDLGIRHQLCHKWGKLTIEETENRINFAQYYTDRNKPKVYKRTIRILETAP